ncbi:hypothetical protein FACS1894110_19710 [Spirochaetia bacterium]|nr:hypothetical protein FACS1894110_19710 [Spirochaetia bacterium]
MIAPIYCYVIKCNGNASALDAFWSDVLIGHNGQSFIRVGEGTEKVEMEVERLDANKVSFGTEARISEKMFLSLSVQYPHVLITMVEDEMEAGVRGYQVFLGGKEYAGDCDFYWNWLDNDELGYFNQKLADKISREYGSLLLKTA